MEPLELTLQEQSQLANLRARPLVDSAYEREDLNGAVGAVWTMRRAAGDHSVLEAAPHLPYVRSRSLSSRSRQHSPHQNFMADLLKHPSSS